MSNDGRFAGNPRQTGAEENESPQANVLLIFVTAVILVAIVVFAYFAASWTLDALADIRLRPMGRTELTGGPHGALPEQPRLEGVEQTQAAAAQTAWVSNLQATRAADEQRLESYGWIDRKTGEVRVPIDVAMSLIVHQLQTQKPESTPPTAKPSAAHPPTP